jgi:glyoxylase-like metal-dependent hydrolase (beta-lactamase superfamily II)
MKASIHQFESLNQMVKPNAFIVETEKHVVIVDTTLTVSDGKALRQRIDKLGKPIAGILYTHGHPDHIAGTMYVDPDGKAPIYALKSVADLMRASEEPKRKQWQDLFKDEWVPRWVHPNRIVKDGETVRIGELDFSVIDLGAGGDCDANSVWLLETENQAAFVGDFIYCQFHSYMADGSVLRWLGNLQRFEDRLSQYETLYNGHGPSGDASVIKKQKEYLLTACACALEATHGTAMFSEETKRHYADKMRQRYPGFGFEFTVPFSADAVAKELVGVKNYD